MIDSDLPFAQLAAGVGIGAPASGGWQPLATCPLLVLVGVTGVGKSTTLAALDASGFTYHLLPDRRELTDRLILPAVQAHAGEPVAPVKDRKLRFAYTRTYRELHPGGMAYALTQLWIEPAGIPTQLLFDGLRGADEVTHAASLLPAARFVVLQAPDVVRVARLMGRGDPFDQIGGAALENPRLDHLQHFADIGVPEAETLFTHLEEQALLEMVRTGTVTAEALRAALAIVGEERRNYDPAAAAAALEQAAPARTLVVDTLRFAPKQVAAQITDFCSL
jgi:hypothetical protein